MHMSRRDFLQAGTCLALGLAQGSALISAAVADAAPALGEKPKAIALTVGLNSVSGDHYTDENGNPWTGDLKGCENDANDMAAIATEAGFATQTLLTKDATRDGVLNAISSAASSLAPEGIFMVSYSGHGGQVPDDPAHRDEYDGADETWCLYDGQVIDDELYQLWNAFPGGARILVISDSCHSGTVVRVASFYNRLSAAHGLDRPTSTRAPLSAFSITTAPANPPVLAQPRYRALPPGAAQRTYKKNQTFYDNLRASTPSEGQNPLNVSVLLFSACQDNQLSSDGDDNGLFTGQLKMIWGHAQDNTRFKGTYRDFHGAILGTMPPYQSPNYLFIGKPNPAYEAQQPFSI